MISRVDTCIQQIKKSVGNMNVLVSRHEYLTFVQNQNWAFEPEN